MATATPARSAGRGGGTLGAGMPTVSFVVNGSLARVSGRFVPLCREIATLRGWRAEFHVTDKAETGVAAARSAAVGGADLVVAVGGDGTVRGCAEGLAGTGITMGIIPHGTANLLARTLGIPIHPRAALKTALATVGVAGTARTSDSAAPAAGGTALTSATTSRDRVIDLATADGATFTAMAGMGLDAAVIGATRLKHQFGWLAYAMSGAAHLKIPPTPFTIKLDGNPPIDREARSVVVGNSGLLPGGFRLLPAARIDDGLLDIGVLAPHGPFGWPRVATRVLTHSQHQDQMLERFQARTVEITAHAPLPREVDGEVVAPGRTLTVTVRPGALMIRVPANARLSSAGFFFLLKQSEKTVNQSTRAGMAGLKACQSLLP